MAFLTVLELGLLLRLTVCSVEFSKSRVKNWAPSTSPVRFPYQTGLLRQSLGTAELWSPVLLYST